ncbi:tail fiber assembly protein [Desulfoluna spongiiphila]|uniref:hypothetical protein n=1 Tax=Desulfoluna spongiiphila TaxID=419481 RepID=UPI00125A64E5|nr:hypothetical protein [Desulfoluna spongiiphila]VVS90791.1 consensus disorder prediction [Desulfoluna spongiiphila]
MDIIKASADRHYIIRDSGKEIVIVASSKAEAESLYLSERTDSASADGLLLAGAEIRTQRNFILLDIYSPVIQQLTRWIDSSEDNPNAQAHYKTQRAAWHAWADSLCDLPDQPGWPWPEGDVPWPEQPPKATRYTAP